MNIVSKAMEYFGLTPLSDLDLPDEPSARVAALPWPPILADSSPRHGSPGEDGPTASAAQAGAVGHLNDWDAMRDDIAFVRDLMVAELAQIDDRKAQLLTAVDALDSIDPTPGGLAAVADVTDIDSRR